jgi:hypothetical protein
MGVVGLEQAEREVAVREETAIESDGRGGGRGEGGGGGRERLHVEDEGGVEERRVVDVEVGEVGVD